MEVGAEVEVAEPEVEVLLLPGLLVEGNIDMYKDRAILVPPVVIPEIDSLSYFVESYSAGQQVPPVNIW